MNTQEKLKAIRARCVGLLKAYDSSLGSQITRSIAGWESTIAAIDLAFATLGIDLCNDICYSDCEACGKVDGMVAEILAAWEGLV